MLCFFAVVISITYFGQITIGTGTETTQLPIDSFDGYTYSEVIYLASEIDAPGTIPTFSCNFAGTTLGDSNVWTIYIGHTSKSSFFRKKTKQLV